MMWTVVGIDAYIEHRSEQALRGADERQLAAMAKVRRRRRAKGPVRQRLRLPRIRSRTG